jgi:hypothetical protein
MFTSEHIGDAAPVPKPPETTYRSYNIVQHVYRTRHNSSREIFYHAILTTATLKTQSCIMSIDLHSLPAGSRLDTAIRNNQPNHPVLERLKLRELVCCSVIIVFFQFRGILRLGLPREIS